MWTNAQKSYQLWLSTPEKYRPSTLKTEEQVAEALSVTPAQLRMWTSLPGWWDDVHSLARKVIGAKLTEILEALTERAIAGNVPAIKLALEALEVSLSKGNPLVQINNNNLGDEIVVIVSAEQASRLSPDELRNLNLTESKTVDGNAKLLLEE